MCQTGNADLFQMNPRYISTLIKVYNKNKKIKCDQDLSSVSELKIVWGKTWQWLVLPNFSDEISCFCLPGSAQTGSSITEEFPGRGKSLCFSWCLWYFFTLSVLCWQSFSTAVWVQSPWAENTAWVQPLGMVLCAGSVHNKLNWSNHFASSIPEHKLTIAVTRAHASSLCLSNSGWNT